MTKRSGLLSLLLCCLCAFLLSCDSDSLVQGPPKFLFIGPETVTLRRDLAAPSPPIATLKHGVRVDILEVRHVMLKVRAQDEADNSVEGWIDLNLLLTSAQLGELNRITQLAARLPSQGKATVQGALNVHTGPNRGTPSLFQIPDNGTVEVLAHRSAPRTAISSAVADALRIKPPAPVRRPKTKAQAPAQKQAQAPAAPLLRAPLAPRLPANWQQMSVPRLSDITRESLDAKNLDSKGRASAAGPPPPPAIEDWSLVRYRSAPSAPTQVGWVLSRMVSLSIPDDTVRYTESRRVTAFLDLGEVDDEGRGKHNWVWTTVSARGKSCDFDSFRVIVWNRVRHRYETAHVERDLEGRYPLKPEQIPPQTSSSVIDPAPKRRSHRAERQAELEQTQFVQTENRFSLVVEDPASGRAYTRTYALVGRRVRLISAVAQGGAAAGNPQNDRGLEGSVASYDPLAETAPETGWWGRAGARIKLGLKPVLRLWTK